MTFISYDFYWPEMDAAAVCANQDAAGAANLLLNGSFATPISNQISFIEKGFIRVVSITSPDDNSGVTFTISGYQNGVFITEDIGGPNNNTVYGTTPFDIITNIITDGGVTNISVGTGGTGYLPLMGVNTRGAFPILNYGIQAIPTNITYQMFRTFYDVYMNGLTIAQQQVQGYWYDRGDGPKNGPYIYDSQSISMVNYMLLSINSTDANPGKLIARYLQT